jgi:hypothetical protein
VFALGKKWDFVEEDHSTVMKIDSFSLSPKTQEGEGERYWEHYGMMMTPPKQTPQRQNIHYSEDWGRVLLDVTAAQKMAYSAHGEERKCVLYECDEFRPITVIWNVHMLCSHYGAYVCLSSGLKTFEVVVKMTTILTLIVECMIFPSTTQKHVQIHRVNVTTIVKRVYAKLSIQHKHVRTRIQTFSV